MSFTVRDAARVKDKITHSGAVLGQYAGAVIGALVGCGVTIATSGAGAATIIPLTVAGAALGKYLGEKLMPAIESGEIKSGAATVFYGPERRNAAHLKDPLKCKGALAATLDKIDPIAPNLGIPSPAEVLDAHVGEFIAEGVREVWIENLDAARVGEQTSMGGIVSTGIESIKIGGTVFALVPRSEQTQDNALFEWALWGLDWGSTIFGGGPLWRKVLAIGAKAAGGVFEKLYGKNSLPSLATKLVEAIAQGKPKEAEEDIEHIARIIENSPEIAKNIENGDYIPPLTVDPKKDDLPSTPADDLRRKKLSQDIEQPGFWTKRVTLQHSH